MQASASGSTSTAGIAASWAMTSDQAMTPGGSVSVRVATSLGRWALAGRSRMRASRSWSQKTIFGSESFSAYSTSSATHQAFMPTTATPIETAAQ